MDIRVRRSSGLVITWGTHRPGKIHTSYPRRTPMTLRSPLSWQNIRFSIYCKEKKSSDCGQLHFHSLLPSEWPWAPRTTCLFQFRLSLRHFGDGPLASFLPFDGSGRRRRTLSVKVDEGIAFSGTKFFRRMYAK